MYKEVKKIISSYFDREIQLERPREKKFGHFATPIAFILAKEQKRAPQVIASEIANKLKEIDIFERVDVVGGYINFTLTEEFLNTHTTDALKNESSFGRGEAKERILLEFVSANPTGPLHIGHARGAIFGDALLRIGRYLGYEITSEYYINDAGNQVYLLGLSIFLAARELLGFEVVYPESYYKGEYITDIAKEAIKSFGNEAFSDESIIPKLSEFGKELMLKEIKENLKAIDIEFDNYVSEKEQFSRWEEIKERLFKAGGLEIIDNKIWLKSSLFGDEKDRVVVRENGEPTYLAGDIIYHAYKFERGFDRYINIWGADHHGYIARIKAAVRFLGYDDSKLEILLSQMVSLLKGKEPYKMSKRAGNFILMKDVVEDIGKDALRLVFLSKKSDTHLEFDVEDLKKSDASNPVYYINYAHARVFSLFEKAGKKMDQVFDIKLKGLKSEVKELLFDALLLPMVLEEAFRHRDPQRVVEYLKSLASSFHSFYNANKIVGQEHEDIYLKLSAMVALSIRVGLRVLGIKALEKM